MNKISRNFCIFRLLIPVMQSYSRAGDFTISGKLKTALIENAIIYGSYLIIFIVCLIYIAVSPDLDVHMWVDVHTVTQTSFLHVWFVELIAVVFLALQIFAENSGNHSEQHVGSHASRPHVGLRPCWSATSRLEQRLHATHALLYLLQNRKTQPRKNWVGRNAGGCPRCGLHGTATTRVMLIIKWLFIEHDWPCFRMWNDRVKESNTTTRCENTLKLSSKR